MLGDFNLTEDTIDRAPLHQDNIVAITALQNLRQCLDLQDTWRHAFPHDRSFTYRATNNGQQIKSRIDRIYTSCEAAKTTFEWETHQTSVPTDHWMVSLRYAPTHAPYIGMGRVTIQTSEIKNEDLTDPIIERGKILQSDLNRIARENVPRETENPQTLWHAFKHDTNKIARKHCKESSRKLTKRIRALESDRKSLANNPELDVDEGLRVNEAYLANELEHLERVQTRDKQNHTRAVISNHGEVLGGIWSAMNKDRKLRDLIYHLKVPNSNPVRYERETRRMAKLSRDFHKNLQEKDIVMQDKDPEYTRKIEEALGEVPVHQRLTNEEVLNTDWSPSYTQVGEALRLLKNGTATALTGAHTNCGKS
ncbi:hypothetical protein EDB83DRAFT_2321315 [Lactarius deliciosus]|nr:hypothetical protein EDB83DRAFT_2321315 [Lactarius deliciosus]